MAAFATMMSSTFDGASANLGFGRSGQTTDAARPLQPIKLFIGGVSRHTTTKQIRDHFSKYGRVMDCIAMRHQDGRSRGFGYVTFDSLATAEQCLGESQVIDGRVVDMKLAIPESPCAMMDVPSVMHNGPSAAGINGGKDVVLQLSSCLGQAQEGIQKPAPSGKLTSLQRLSPGDRAKLFEELAEAYPDLSDDALLQLAAGDWSGLEGAQTKPLSGMTDCSVMQEQPKIETSVTLLPQSDSIRPQPLLNLQRLSPSDRLQLFEELAQMYPDLSDDELIELAAGGELPLETNARPPPPQMAPPPPPAVSGADKSDDEASTDANSSNSSPNTLLRFPEDSDDEQQGIMEQVSEAGLPSVGSARHALGECRRCNFFAKGRCDNGKDCMFCHLPHEQRNKTRREKRDRKTAWLDQRTHRVQDTTLGQQQQQQQQQQQPISLTAAAAPKLQTLTLSELLSDSLPPVSLESAEINKCGKGKGAEECQKNEFEFAAGFVNFADYTDDESDEDDFDFAQEAAPLLLPTTELAESCPEEDDVQQPDTLDFPAADTTESSVPTLEVEKTECVWSREDMLCVMTAMKARDALHSSLAARSSVWRSARM